jgi:adenylate cyclase
MLPIKSSPLETIEPRLRPFLPADLYATAWVDPSPTTLEKVFEHLRTLQRILNDYTSRSTVQDPPRPGEERQKWQRGTLMFTDLAGFTRLMEANASQGRAGAGTLLGVLNAYFAKMIELISKSGGDLLEFTGDALLVLFPDNARKDDAVKAVRAGLRMQRAMSEFAEIETPQGMLHLGMRIGIHTGRFLSADIGTPRRMEHVLLGRAVQDTKLAESAGVKDRVCLSTAVYERIKDEFQCEEHQSKDGKRDYKLVIDNLSDDQLGEYELTTSMRRRQANLVLFERSVASLIEQIESLLDSLEPLASFFPPPILNLLVESAADRHIPPDFPEPTVVFVNFIGLPETVDRAMPGEERKIINAFSRAFAQINAAVEARGGVLKKITYHLSGSDIVIYFGAPIAHSNDTERAASAALAIRDIVMNLKAPRVAGKTPEIICQIGINYGAAFAAEVGEPRGRREFNVLGDTVNISARLMNRAEPNQILVTGRAFERSKDAFDYEFIDDVSLKGKAETTPIYELRGVRHQE